MKLITQEVSLIAPTPKDYSQILNTIELAYRTCYNSQTSSTDAEKEAFIKRMIASGHESPLEHVNLSVEIITDRAVSHELVRHRIASYSQQSQRYCNYSKDKYGSQVSFIQPHWLHDADEDTYYSYLNVLSTCEQVYMNLIEKGFPTQDARGVLPNATATKLVMTMNIRSWRNFLKLRSIGTTGKPHPDMQILADKILNLFSEHFPVFFNDLQLQRNTKKETSTACTSTQKEDCNDTPLKDNVNHPEHYQGKFECIDEMISLFGVEAVKDFCRCNAYKYRFRADRKNGLEDIKKAEWYMTKLKELERNDDE